MTSKRYLLYARKSSESEDRQVLSVEAQISEMRAIAGREGAQIIETFAEARSAKTAVDTSLSTSRKRRETHGAQRIP
jgi:hypothetical protein